MRLVVLVLVGCGSGHAAEMPLVVVDHDAGQVADSAPVEASVVDVAIGPDVEPEDASVPDEAAAEASVPPDASAPETSAGGNVCPAGGVQTVCIYDPVHPPFTVWRSNGTAMTGTSCWLNSPNCPSGLTCSNAYGVGVCP